jgi:hypothetical protein
VAGKMVCGEYVTEQKASSHIVHPPVGSDQTCFRRVCWPKKRGLIRDLADRFCCDNDLVMEHR